jgi:hypothetical protein
MTCHHLHQIKTLKMIMVLLKNHNGNSQNELLDLPLWIYTPDVSLLDHDRDWGVCGYDKFVHPDHCKLLFQFLIIHGGACPMDPYHVIVVVVRTTGLVKSRCKLYHTNRRSRKNVRRMMYLLVLRCSPCYMFYGYGQ